MNKLQINNDKFTKLGGGSAKIEYSLFPGGDLSENQNRISRQIALKRIYKQ